MLFAIDAGNTNIHVGIFDKNELKHTFNISTQTKHSASEYSLIFKLFINDCGYKTNEIEAFLIASVVPLITPIIKEAALKIQDAPVITVGPGVKTGFSIKLDDPSDLGADLAANTAGAISKVGAPCIIIDFGTATTVSVIDERGAFAGCSIMPGVQMSFDALHSTGLLPNVAFDNSRITHLGKNSINAMRSGVCCGAVMACEGFIQAFKSEQNLPEDTKTVICGGYAKDLLKYFKSKPEYIADLTLHGLKVIYDLNKKR
jgi:type III pantothenate kinase